MSDFEQRVEATLATLVAGQEKFAIGQARLVILAEANTRDLRLLAERFGAHAEKLAEHDRYFEKLDRKIDAVADDVTAVRLDMKDVKADVRVLKEDVSVLKTDVKAIVRSLGRVEDHV